MHGLTQRELLLIEDQLRAEKVAINKFRQCAEQFDDPEFKQLCTAAAEKHREHYNTLLKQLNIYTELH
ncbi:MAG: spore coat protein [Dethiobacteria bacterium]|jgi:rubrerythrin|nr:spore coat protein [Bacillota bacterium]